MAQLRVLLVDDDPTLLETIKDLLTHSDYDVVTAICGQDAIEKLDSSIDLIISDVRMPNGDGMFVLKEAKKKFAEIPILILTGFSDYKEEELTASGADQILHKPLNIELLLDLIETRYAK